MSLRTEVCSHCRGAKTAEQLQEKVGGIWRPLPAHCVDGMPQYAIDEMLERHAAEKGEGVFLAYRTVTCPACDGAGTNLVEYFTCKIF